MRSNVNAFASLEDRKQRTETVDPCLTATKICAGRRAPPQRSPSETPIEPVVANDSKRPF